LQSSRQLATYPFTYYNSVLLAKRGDSSPVGVNANITIYHKDLQIKIPLPKDCCLNLSEFSIFLFMTTVTLKIEDCKALELLRQLENLKIFSIINALEVPVNLQKYEGAMSKQPLEEIDQQLKELRDSWE
jgi:hypothetical protein